MKKAISLFLALMLCLSLAAPALAADETSGTCGENVTWSFSGGTLTIEGTGSVYDQFDAETSEVFRGGMPWGRYYEEIRAVNIADGVTGIGTGAFSGCSSLTGVTIPASVTYIGAGAFDSCTSLASINVASGNTAYSSVDGVLFSADQTLLHSYPAGKSGLSYSIPESVTTIGNFAFDGCGALTGVTIPDSVTTIKRVAFMNCGSLTSITIPDSVTTIGDNAFSRCGSLTSVTISGGLTTLEDGVFYYCSSLTSVTIPDSVTSIGSSFRRCEGLTSVTIPGNVTSIGDFAFDGCSALTSVTIPASVASIGMCAFYECYKLTDIYYGGSESQWKQIAMNDIDGNNLLLGATIHYNSAAPAPSTDPAPETPDGITVTVGGKAVQWTDVKPFIDENDRTMVPLRAVADAMGLDVTWDAGNREAIFADESKMIAFPIDSTTARPSEGDPVQMDTAAVIVNDRTYAPIRYLAEFFGYEVGWDQAAKTVSIK